jgi:cation:H+ antiporter
MLPVDLALLGLGAFGVYLSIDWLVDWISARRAGFINAQHMGWLSGWLMVLPNALLALYYGWRGKPEVTYASQVGDGHICIPLCVGIYALYHPLVVPGLFQTGVWMLLGAAAAHFLCVALLGQLPRLAGLGFILAYAWFVVRGWLK